MVENMSDFTVKLNKTWMFHFINNKIRSKKKKKKKKPPNQNINTLKMYENLETLISEIWSLNILSCKVFLGSFP